MYIFFFFKQKTAYEIYQCDWSSDVCSSDLGVDYMLNRFLIVGVDFRYHLASGINSIETSSFTSGVKVGFRF